MSTKAKLPELESDGRTPFRPYMLRPIAPINPPARGEQLHCVLHDKIAPEHIGARHGSRALVTAVFELGDGQHLRAVVFVNGKWSADDRNPSFTTPRLIQTGLSDAAGNVRSDADHTTGTIESLPFRGRIKAINVEVSLQPTATGIEVKAQRVT